MNGLNDISPVEMKEQCPTKRINEYFPAKEILTSKGDTYPSKGMIEHFPANFLADTYYESARKCDKAVEQSGV